MVRLLDGSTAVPLLHGQAWHFISHDFLAKSDDITEILHTHVSSADSG